MCRYSVNYLLNELAWWNRFLLVDKKKKDFTHTVGIFGCSMTPLLLTHKKETRKGEHTHFFREALMVSFS